MPRFEIFSKLKLRIFFFPMMFWGAVIAYCRHRSGDGVLFNFVSESGVVILCVIGIMTFVRGMKDRKRIGEVLLSATGVAFRIGNAELEISAADLRSLSVSKLGKSPVRLYLPKNTPGSCAVITWTQLDLGALLRAIKAVHGVQVGARTRSMLQRARGQFTQITLKTMFAICASTSLVVFGVVSCGRDLGLTDSPDALAPLAFPGAMGLGKNTPGGRGGQVIKVTNLNDSGPGSLRAALTTAGPRIVVFAVSGNIDLTSILSVTEPYLTLAGQSSPGGISVSGKQFNISTHDVIVRHMRFRSGGHRYGGTDSDGDSFSLFGAHWNGGFSVYNVMIDHCSFTWGTDETFSITGGATATTLQYNLIGQGLRYAKLGTSDHSKGLMISGKYHQDTEVSLYRNYIAHNTDRSPLMYKPPADNTSFLVDATNNVSYNWKGGSRPSAGGDARVNWIANFAKEGPYSNRQDFIMQGESLVSPAEEMVFILGNIGTGRSATDPEWRVSVNYTNVLLASTYQHATRWETSAPLPYETMTPELASAIVARSGATLPLRDAIDSAIVNSFDAGTSLLKDTVSYPADWPTYSTANDHPSDIDSDGMPDAWESSFFGDLSKTASGDEDGDGYTNIEEYLNSL